LRLKFEPTIFEAKKQFPPAVGSFNWSKYNIENFQLVFNWFQLVKYNIEIKSTISFVDLNRQNVAKIKAQVQKG